MKQAIALCTVSILIGCASVPAPHARDESAGQRPEREAIAAQLDSTPASDAAARRAKRALADERVQRIEASQGAMAAASLVASARERVLYLWSMLPQQNNAKCSDAPAVSDCRAEAQAISTQFEQELAQSDATYDEENALRLYEASRVKSAECMTPEFECLVAKFDGFGGNSETHRDMAEALKALELRQQLVVETGLEASLPCLDAGVQQYQSRIAQDYQRFAREPALAAQAQLHRDYRGQYDAQVACLQTSGRSLRTADNH